MFCKVTEHDGQWEHRPFWRNEDGTVTERQPDAKYESALILQSTASSPKAFFFTIFILHVWAAFSILLTFLNLITRRIQYWIIIIISIQPLGQFGQEPEPSQATGMPLVRCILGKFLGVVCHCFPPRLDVPTFAARCLHVRNDAWDPSSERWNYGRERLSGNFDYMASLCRKYTTWDRRLYFPSEGRSVDEIFRP